jgi:hypothetical protein
MQNGATTFALFKKAAKKADKNLKQAKQTVRKIAPKKASEKVNFDLLDTPGRACVCMCVCVCVCVCVGMPYHAKATMLQIFSSALARSPSLTGSNAYMQAKQAVKKATSTVRQPVKKAKQVAQKAQVPTGARQTVTLYTHPEVIPLLSPGRGFHATAAWSYLV